MANIPYNVVWVGHSIVNSSAPWNCNGNSLFAPPDKLGKTHICRVPDYNYYNSSLLHFVPGQVKNNNKILPSQHLFTSHK